ncbi:uncharacterized protein PAC_13012 [Phialocephala subalpina]|uniref:Pisatin demethylase cytochrome P450 n=1 Tax=Phialocephala subalpina TaxID=576137 RepID=A0A1L7XDK4_9HELO|nr:uncharacterized protein PAC_13012 [Phialocephala subalpina]
MAVQIVYVLVGLSLVYFLRIRFLETLVRLHSFSEDNLRRFASEIWLQKRFVATGATMDMMEWATYWSLEVIYDLTFGERIGYVEEGKDVNGVIFGVRKMAAWWLYLSRAPFLDYRLLKNPLILWCNKHGWFDHPNVFMPIVQRQFFERQEHWKEVGNMKTVAGDRPTLTEMFLKAQQDHPEVQDFQPFMHSMSTIGAATEATAITLSSVIYFLLKNPRCYEKLKSELSTLPAPASPVIFIQAQSLPYLNACINESMRLHSADRFAKGREVPESGMTICGQFVPGGTTVSVYTDAAHRQKEIFGNDVDVFKPERWLESEEKTNRMNATMLSFGIGKYGCLEKNLSRLEMLKFIPSVLRAFDFELVNPEQDWTLVNGPFAHPVDLFVKVQARS